MTACSEALQMIPPEACAGLSARLLYSRARARHARRASAEALHDLDAALALDPENAPCLSLKSEASSCPQDNNAIGFIALRTLQCLF